MRHLRRDYDGIQPFPTKRQHWVKVDGETVLAGDGTVANANIDTLGKHMDPIIPDDEPVFLLRASDPVASEAVRVWADLAEQAGADMNLCHRVRLWVDEMDAYYHEDTSHKSAPDTPEGLLR